MLSNIEQLAADLATILTDGGPSFRHLEDAPLINNWSLSTRPESCLLGSVSGHPLIGQNRPAITSGIYAIDRDAGWVRTWSRFYLLGSHISENGSVQ